MADAVKSPKSKAVDKKEDSSAKNEVKRIKEKS